ncbi:hypothetical protein D3C71_1234290 [compost metagenome]
MPQQQHVAYFRKFRTVHIGGSTLEGIGIVELLDVVDARYRRSPLQVKRQRPVNEDHLTGFRQRLKSEFLVLSVDTACRIPDVLLQQQLSPVSGACRPDLHFMIHQNPFQSIGPAHHPGHIRYVAVAILKHPPVLIHLLPLPEHDVRLFLRRLVEQRHQLAVYKVVAVQKEDIVTRRLFNPLVSGRADTAVILGYQAEMAGRSPVDKAPHRLGRTVLRSVIHDNRFKIQVTLGGQRLKRPFDIALHIVSRNNHTKLHESSSLSPFTFKPSPSIFKRSSHSSPCAAG